MSEYIMKRPCVLFLLMLCAFGLAANDGSYINGSPGVLYLSKSEDIIMTSEVITIDIYFNSSTNSFQAQYDCVYRFKNNTDQNKSLLVGFPLMLGRYESSVLYEPEMLSQFDVHNFETRIDGKPVRVEENIDGGKYDIVYSFNADWDPRQEITISHTYDVFYGFDFGRGIVKFAYIVLTGNSWAGPIKDAVFNIRLHKPLRGYENEYNGQSTYSLLVGIYGKDSVALIKDDNLEEYRIHLKDWTPAMDVHFRFSGKDTLSDSTYTELPSNLMTKAEFDQKNEIARKKRISLILDALNNSDGNPSLIRLPSLLKAYFPLGDSLDDVADILDSYFDKALSNILSSSDPDKYKSVVGYVLLNYESDYSYGYKTSWRQKIYEEYMPVWYEQLKTGDHRAATLAYAMMNGLFSARSVGFCMSNYYDLFEKHDYYRQLYYALGDYYYDSKPEKALSAYQDAFFLTSTVKELYKSDWYDLYTGYFYLHPKSMDFNHNFPADSWIDEGTDNAPCYYIAYNMACLYASSLEEYDQALYWLEFALKMGYPNYDWLQKDADMQYLRDNYSERFYALLAEY